MPKLENIGLDLALKSAFQAVVQAWQMEIIFLITKFGLWARLLKRSRYSNPRLSPKKEELEKELLRLVDQDFQLFQKKAERLKGEWKANKSLDQASLAAALKELGTLRRQWQELKSKQRQLEIQILEELIQSYPTKIF